MGEPRIAQTDCGIGAKGSPAIRDHRMTAHVLSPVRADREQGPSGVHGRAFMTCEPATLPCQHDAWL
jgi:hypothetical protein